MDDIRRLSVGVIGAGSVAARHVRSLQRLPGVEVVGVVDTDADRANSLVDAAGGPAQAFPRCRPCWRAVFWTPLTSACRRSRTGRPSSRCSRRGSRSSSRSRSLSTSRSPRRLLPVFVRTASSPPPAITGATTTRSSRPPGSAPSTPSRLLSPRGWTSCHRRHGGRTSLSRAARSWSRQLTSSTCCESSSEVVTVHAAGNRLNRGLDGDVDDACAATPRFESGAVASLASTSLLGWKHRTRVDLFADGVAIHLAEDDLLVRRVDGEERRVPATDARSAADAAFIAAVRTGNPGDIRVPYDEAMRTHRVATAIARAAVDGSVVELTGYRVPANQRVGARPGRRTAGRPHGARAARRAAGAGDGVRRHPFQRGVARN